jgi:hypothetical protein
MLEFEATNIRWLSPRKLHDRGRLASVDELGTSSSQHG